MKPLSKEELIKEAKRYRDTLRGMVPDSMMVSDEQIEKNVNKKYDMYCTSVDFSDKELGNGARFKEFCKSKNQKSYVDYRSVECASIDENEFENRLKEVNTPEKAKHYRNKTIETIVKGNYKDLADSLVNIEKFPEYLKNNYDFINKSMASGSLIDRTEVEDLSENNCKLIKDNLKIFESLACETKPIIRFNASPISMLFEGYTNPLPDKVSGQVMASAIATGICPMTKNTVDEVVLGEAFFSFPAAHASDETKKINDYLQKNNITDLSTLKPEKEGQTIQDAVLNDGKLVKKSDEEIKEMNDAFNKHEGAALVSRKNNPETSIPLTKEEQAKAALEEMRLETIAKQNAAFEARQKEIEDQNKQIARTAAENKIAYESQSGASRFFSHFLPNSWTKTGRMRQVMKESIQAVKSRGLDDEFNRAYEDLKPRISSRRVGGEYKDDAIMQDVQDIKDTIENSNILSTDAKSTKKQREQSKSMIGEEKEIEIPDEEADEDEMETPTPKGRKSIVIADAKDTPNSSRENVAKEQSNQKAMEASNEMDDDELDLD